MNAEWDEAKRRINLRKHGIDFVDWIKVFRGATKTLIDDREEYGEHRYITFGLLEGRVVAVVHTEFDEVIRIISIRKAIRHEQALYFQGLED